MARILALDLGKFKRDSCFQDVVSGEATFPKLTKEGGYGEFGGVLGRSERCKGCSR